MSILKIIEYALGLLKHAFEAYNNSSQVQAKIAQMSQNDKDRHAELLNQAMNAPTIAERQKAVEEIRKLVSE